ncbi:MAG: hypothetical protein PHY29_02765 [Syntrophales bacterium]|nr:hypothetical protein [Syntrophales bacterium]
MSNIKKELPANIIKALGTKPDSALASEASVSVERIRRERMKLGIESHRRYFAWTEEMDALLGTVPDAELAEQLGISLQAVLHHRENRRIDPHRPMMKYKTQVRAIGAVSLTAHISENARKQVVDLMAPLLEIYRETGLPVREINMWQVIEYAINKLHRELVRDKKEAKNETL